MPPTGTRALAGAVADQGVEEAAVLDQRRRRASRRRCRCSASVATIAADRVVGEPPLDHLAQRDRRRARARCPGRPVSATWSLGRQRLQQRRRDDPGHARRPRRRTRARRRTPRPPPVSAERVAGGRALRSLDEQAAGLAVADHRRVRRHRARREPDVELEVLDDLLRHQPDQVGVARQPGVEAGERRRGHRRAADAIRAARGPAPTARPGPGRRRRRARCGRRRRRRRRTCCSSPANLVTRRGRCPGGGRPRNIQSSTTVEAGVHHRDRR